MWQMTGKTQWLLLVSESGECVVQLRCLLLTGKSDD